MKCLNSVLTTLYWPTLVETQENTDVDFESGVTLTAPHEQL